MHIIRHCVACFAALPDTGFDCSGLVAHVFGQAWGLALRQCAESIDHPY